MNAGLGNLTTLKTHLLAKSLRSGTDFDTTILAIGLGIAGLIDTYTNRKMAYKADASVTVTGDRDHYYVDRYPFVSITSVQMRYFRTDDWTDITDQPIQTNEETGLVRFGFTVGSSQLQLRIVWTGGYWFETLDQGDDGYPSAPPDGVALLPDEIKLAWLLQCGEVWNKMDKLGAGITREPDSLSKLGTLELSPLVKTMLQPHRRFQLT